MKFARLKQFATSAALMASMVFSLGMGMPAAAMAATPMDGMSHEGANFTNCINQHHIAPGSTTKVDTNELNDDEPEPQPLPYFTQFLPTAISTIQTPPKDVVRSSSYRPPDIVRLTGNIRF